MNILTISCSNTHHMGENSISYLTAQYMKDLLIKNGYQHEDIKTISLQNYELSSCTFCGACAKTQNCPYDQAFNSIFELINQSNYIFFIVPYYAIVPAKLTMILEKINEMFYASWLDNPNYQPKSSKIRVGIIGHGGMVENNQVLKFYHTNLITPIANTLKGLGFNIIKATDEYPLGIPFGLLKDSDIFKDDQHIFPKILHDEKHIKDRICVFVEQIVK